MLAALLGAALAASSTFQSPLGFSLTLPPGFSPMADLKEAKTRAVAPAPPGADVQLLAAFVEGHDNPSSLAIALVDAPLALDRGNPERAAELAVDYFHDLFNLDLHIEWIERLPEAGAPGPEAIELVGRVAFPGSDGAAPEERIAQFAFVPFGRRRLVITASVPAARIESVGPLIESAISSLAFAPGAVREDAHGGQLWTALGGGALGLVVAMTRLLWWRRRAFLTGEKEDR